MIITLKLRPPKGVNKTTAHENIALYVFKKITKRQLKGLIGEEHPFQKTDIQNWIEECCLKRKYLSIADRTRNDYWGFCERLYDTIMRNYIRRDELTKDTDEKVNESPYYFPGLVYIKGLGYIITNSNDLIDKYKEQREDNLEGQKLHLKQKCIDASDFVKLLKSGDTPRLNGNSREIA